MPKNWTTKHLGRKLRDRYGDISMSIICKVLISNKETSIIVVAAGYNWPKSPLVVSWWEL